MLDSKLYILNIWSPLLLSTYIVSENHTQLPDLVLDIDGVEPGKKTC